MADARFRVAVVGAGPAGATAANALSLSGVGDIALIDRARFPRDKTCGDGITGTAAALMREIALDHLLAQHPKVEKVVMTAPSGAQAIADIREEQTLSETYVIPRTVFDAYLANAALERGAADFTGYKLERAEWRDGRWTLHLSDGEGAGGTRSIGADFLISADGATSRVRRTLGIPFNPEKRTLIAIRAYATFASRQVPQMRFEMVDGIFRSGYAWMFGYGPHEANIGVGLFLTHYKAQSRHLRDVLDLYAGYLGDGIVVDRASMQSAPLPGAAPLPRLAVPQLHAALIGDAASMINCTTGEGISYGMAAGLLLGRLLADAMANGSSLAAAAQRYEQEFRRQYSGHLRDNFHLSLLLSTSVWSQFALERMVKNYRRSDRAYKDALRFISGVQPTVPFTSMLWHGLVRS